MRVDEGFCAIPDINPSVKSKSNCHKNMDCLKSPDKALSADCSDSYEACRDSSNSKKYLHIQTSSQNHAVRLPKKVKPPIFRAAESGNLQKLRSNLDKGVSPNYPCHDQKFLWPIIAACVFSKIECVQMLLEKGADPNVVDVSGNSPLYYSIGRMNEKPEICQLLLEHGARIEEKFGFDRMTMYRFEDPETNDNMSEKGKIIYDLINRYRKN